VKDSEYVKKQLVDTNQAAEILGCEASTVRKWIAQRRLPSVKIGRLRRLRLEDLQRIVASGLGDGTRN
jgi:excisionase family DNA binding protein